MANISNEELRMKLFPQETIDFLEKHPSYYGRAAKMYAGASAKYTNKKVKYIFKKMKDEFDATSEMINSHPEFFPSEID
ncbi:hypothetical protein [Bacillus paranthracis]|uniref:hypothetical protein n=1 Tax=Bacillus paranthracis TaxID=2026186 RepID=UPI00397ECE8C